MKTLERLILPNITPRPGPSAAWLARNGLILNKVSTRPRRRSKLPQLVQVAGSGLGRRLDSSKAAVEKRMWTKLADVLDDTSTLTERTEQQPQVVVHPLSHRCAAA